MQRLYKFDAMLYPCLNPLTGQLVYQQALLSPLELKSGGDFLWMEQVLERCVIV